MIVPFRKSFGAFIFALAAMLAAARLALRVDRTNEGRVRDQSCEAECELQVYFHDTPSSSLSVAQGDLVHLFSTNART
jgi:hypothetical protein